MCGACRPYRRGRWGPNRDAHAAQPTVGGISADGIHGKIRLPDDPPSARAWLDDEAAFNLQDAFRLFLGTSVAYLGDLVVHAAEHLAVRPSIRIANRLRRYQDRRGTLRFTSAASRQSGRLPPPCLSFFPSPRLSLHDKDDPTGTRAVTGRATCSQSFRAASIQLKVFGNLPLTPSPAKSANHEDCTSRRNHARPGLAESTGRDDSRGVRPRVYTPLTTSIEVEPPTDAKRASPKCVKRRSPKRPQI